MESGSGEHEHRWENVKATMCTPSAEFQFCFGPGSTGQDWWRIEVKTVGGQIYRNESESLGGREIEGVPNWRQCSHNLGEADNEQTLTFRVSRTIFCMCHGGTDREPDTLAVQSDATSAVPNTPSITEVRMTCGELKSALDSMFAYVAEVSEIWLIAVSLHAR